VEPENAASIRRQSQDHWAQSKADLTTASVLRDAGIYYASVFFAQQAAEKALKAATLSLSKRNPRGHNLIQFANELEAPLAVMNAAAELNLEFLATRNPEHAEGVPAQMYDQTSAEVHLRAAETVIEWARGLI
jgi:Uncharacterized conserved protein related to C-terminal domain of eukaryotic chaperone, SACSIN